MKALVRLQHVGGIPDTGARHRRTLRASGSARSTFLAKRPSGLAAGQRTNREDKGHEQGGSRWHGGTQRAARCKARHKCARKSQVQRTCWCCCPAACQTKPMARCGSCHHHHTSRSLGWKAHRRRCLMALKGRCTQVQKSLGLWPATCQRAKPCQSRESGPECCGTSHTQAGLDLRCQLSRCTQVR